MIGNMNKLSKTRKEEMYEVQNSIFFSRNTASESSAYDG